MFGMELKTKQNQYVAASMIMKKSTWKLNLILTNLPLNKPLKFNMMTIIIRSVFEKDGKLYLHIFLDDALFELII